MLYYFFIGALLGLSAGFSPGPLLALVMSETLRHGRWAGVKVAFAPLLTDLPIIGFALFVLTKISDAGWVLAILSFSGAAFVAWMGVENLRCNTATIELEKQAPRSFRKGVITNLLSPHPYLFWLTVGVPIMNQAKQHHFIQAALFLLSFYILLVGSKVVLALMVGRSRNFLRGRSYLLLLRALGGLLCLFAVILFYEGVKLLLYH